MNFVRPIEALVPGAQGRLLSVLAETTAELSLRTLSRLAAVSPAQTSRILPGLVEIGLVERRDVPPSALFRLVPEHLLAGPLHSIARSGETACAEIRRLAASIHPSPVSIVAFGSFARGQATAPSDLDLLVVRADEVDEDDDSWISTLDQWHRRVTLFTGNRTDVMEVPLSEALQKLKAGGGLWSDIRRDGLVLHGASLNELTEVPVA